MSEITPGERKIARNISFLRSQVLFIGTVLVTVAVLIFVEPSDAVAYDLVWIVFVLLAWSGIDYLLHMLEYNTSFQRAISTVAEVVGLPDPYANDEEVQG